LKDIFFADYNKFDCHHPWLTVNMPSEKTKFNQRWLAEKDANGSHT